jgi:pimeloyl-ACP methyl ester carboxylesterase
MIHTHQTAPTQFVEANSIRYAYRRFGKPGRIPLLFLEYFNSNMDGWDPDVTNSFAADHEVILFDNDLPVSRDSAVAQVAALKGWGTIPATGRYATLKSITHPTLMVHGNKDIVVTPINAFILAEHLPNAQLIMYADSSHGAF